MSGEPRAIESEGQAGWQVRLASYQGPLEILLHLIRTGEVDPTGLPILEIARQYDAWLEGVKSLDMDLAGEYLVLAATLVHMKSRRLLPPDPADAAAEPPLEATAAPPAAQGMRRAAEHLQEREASMELIFARPAERVSEFASEQGIEADLSALLRAFQAILRRVGSDPAARVSRERITLVERINWLLETLQRERRIGFRDLFAAAEDRMSCILTFLALLELIRLRLVQAFQSHHQEDLLITLADEPPGPGGAAPEERTDA